LFQKGRLENLRNHKSQEIGYFGKVAMKKTKTVLKELRAELHYWQMRARIDARSLKGTREKVKEIAARMRQAQK
jgi:hypothetical protein